MNGAAAWPRSWSSSGSGSQRGSDVPLVDADIMQQVQRGRTELFDQLVDRYRDRLLRFAAAKLGDPVRAEDVVQETFLAVFAARHTYDPRFAFSTWIWTILLNLCRREWRCRRREAGRLWSSGRREASGERGSMTSETGLSALLQTEQQELLQSLLEELPEAEADALRLRFFGGLKFEEIAEAMQSSLSGAKVRVKKGLRRLSDRIREQTARNDEPAQSPGALHAPGRNRHEL
jgi:RNA polymerase sigma-70 factor (ECF subfamily)